MIDECNLKVYLYTKYLLCIVVNFNFWSNFRTVIKYILKMIKTYLHDFKISPEIFV